MTRTSRRWRGKVVIALFAATAALAGGTQALTAAPAAGAVDLDNCINRLDLGYVEVCLDDDGGGTGGGIDPQGGADEQSSSENTRSAALAEPIPLAQGKAEPQPIPTCMDRSDQQDDSTGTPGLPWIDDWSLARCKKDPPSPQELRRLRRELSDLADRLSTCEEADQIIEGVVWFKHQLIAAHLPHERILRDSGLDGVAVRAARTWWLHNCRTRPGL